MLKAAFNVCFIEGTQVLAPSSTATIEQVEPGDRVVAAASTDGGEEAWVKVESAPAERRGAWSPRGVCSRIARAGRKAVLPAMLAACDPASAAVELPSDVAVVQVYDARTGAWERGTVGDLEVGDEVLHEGHLLRVTSDGVDDRGFAEVSQLSEADATWTVDGVARVPVGDDWVLVLGDADDAGHWRLQDLTVGERFAFGGRVFETGVLDDALAVRATDHVLAEVVRTFQRMVVDEVIDLQVSFPDGEKAVITGTHEHPFYVPAVDRYVALGELDPGTVLRTDAGSEAIVVELTRREGEFEVFNIEVAEAHNYFVRGAGFEGPGVLVHNKSMKLPVLFTGGQVGQKFGRHGKEFGLEMSADGARAYKKMAQEVVALPDEVRKGTWNPKGGGGDNYNFYAQDGALVITDADDNFVTMFKQSEGGNKWFNNATPVD